MKMMPSNYLPHKAIEKKYEGLLSQPLIIKLYFLGKSVEADIKSNLNLVSVVLNVVRTVCESFSKQDSVVNTCASNTCHSRSCGKSIRSWCLKYSIC